MRRGRRLLNVGQRKGVFTSLDRSVKSSPKQVEKRMEVRVHNAPKQAEKGSEDGEFTTQIVRVS